MKGKEEKNKEVLCGLDVICPKLISYLH